MDRLSSLLDLFRPSTEKVEVLTPQQAGIDFTGDSTIALVRCGSACLIQNNNTETTLNAGDLLWITPGHKPGLKLMSEDFQLLCCHLRFGPVRLNPLFDIIPAIVQISADEPSRQNLNPIIQLLLEESLLPRCGQETVLNRLAEVLLVHVLRYVMKHQKIETGVLAGLADIRLARAITAIHRHPDQRWSVQSLANEAGMSRTAFNQFFRETVGCTPGEYLIQWRMRLACRWLETSQVMVGQIVDRLGYQSETAFFRAFRRQIGMSPGQYRDKISATSQ